MDRSLLFRLVHLYCDEKRNEVALVPNGWREKLGIVSLSIVERIRLPFGEEELYQAVMSMLNRCYSMERRNFLRKTIR
ncbi:hypothetical protein BCM02_107312 [Paenibacillus methanolicus]|uniref:Uncharacterized protein n=1 Tax=Paenibacillus methanolicus TaxID=582686 RepID=A0A5S5C3Y3_9BACL|nr:hypothetical protein BCM02_107312 [Paenibacillus methanolicus]